MNTCERCGKAVGSGEWDIHTCTPKPGLCDGCETRHQALEKMAQNARELGLDYESSESNKAAYQRGYLDGMAKPCVECADRTELEKDAANLLFALHDAWPYVHQWCTIESRKKNIQALIRKHGDFADTFKKPRLTDEQIQEIAFVAVRDNWDWLQFARAIEAKVREPNK